MTFDAVLGYIGGLYAIIWAFFGCLIQNYNSFSKDITLISNFYTTEDQKMIHILGRTKSDSIDMDKKNDQMKKEILGEMTLRKEYKYNYCSYTLANILRCCFCCPNLTCI